LGILVENEYWEQITKHSKIIIIFFKVYYSAIHTKILSMLSQHIFVHGLTNATTYSLVHIQYLHNLSLT